MSNERFDHYDLSFSQRSVILAHLARTEKLKAEMQDQLNQLVGKIVTEEFGIDLEDGEIVTFDDNIETFRIVREGELEGESSD